MIDGANDFTILFKIILPLSKATLAVVVLFYVVEHWNSWFSASIYLRDRERFPLQLSSEKSSFPARPARRRARPAL